MLDAKSLIFDHQVRRLRILLFVYEQARGLQSVGVPWSSVQEALGLTENQVAQAMQYLAGEGLAAPKLNSSGPLIELTHPGIVEIEQAIVSPAIGTAHFPPPVVANIVGDATPANDSSSEAIEGIIQGEPSQNVDGNDHPAAERIRALMNRLNMNQAQAAAYLGVPQPTMANWLSGNREPSASVVRLLDVLGTIEVLAPNVHESLLPSRGRKTQ